jgi:hypothetical protein
VEELVDPFESRRLDILNELRALRDQRQISDDEYQRRYNGPYMSGGHGVGRSSTLGVLIYTAHFNNPKLLDASIRIGDSVFVFRFDENVVPHRSIIVREGDGALQISFVGDAVLDIHQSPTGSVRLSLVGDDQTTRLNLDSFAEVYEKHSEFVMGQFLPLAKKSGLDLPPEGP